MEKKRIGWVDIFKALGILLVVVGHTASPFNVYIYAFHMSAFFFISGYTTDFSKTDFKKFLIGKINRILIPYLSINLLFYLFKSLFSLSPYYHYFYSDLITTDQLVSFFSRLNTVDLGGATWFLVVLFEASISCKLIYDLSQKVQLKYFWVLVISFILLLYAYSLYASNKRLDYMFDLVLSALFYLMIGNSFKRYNLFAKLKGYYTLPICLALAYYFTNIKWSGMDWPSRNFADPFANIVMSISATYILYFISNSIDKIKLVKEFFYYVGQRTMSILMLHFGGFRVLLAIFYYLGLCEREQLRGLGLSNPCYWWISVIFGISFSLLLEFLISRSSILSYFILGYKNDKIDQRIENIFFTGV